MGKKAVLFDRDGVINQSIVRNGKPFPPQTMAEFKWVEKVRETLETLSSIDYLLVIFTNQPDVGRGQQSLQQVGIFHEHIKKTLPVAQIYTCFHDNKDQCECRKPKPGMIFEAQNDWEIDLQQSFVVGDRWRDIDAGNEAGCQTIWLDYGYDEALRSQPDYTIKHLHQILDIIH
ncbi:MAG: HAD-IIIA family hydrolase [SAR324 cluster bacterium]|nr:HAD-IIIA family hydrolase [SAR324 cluster bacterium]